MIRELFLLLAAVWIVGRIFRFIKLPAIFGEILAGVIVGPLILGVVHETGELKALAELGIFFLMLHAGLERDPTTFFHATKKGFPIAVGGMLLPLIGGYYLSRYFGYPVNESLYVGLGLSITAIAVSVRLFKDYNLQDTNTAHATMGAALIDDILSLILFSLIITVAEKGTVDFAMLLLLIVKILGFFGVVYFLGQKMLPRMQKLLSAGNKSFTLLIIIGLGFGLIAELIGLHMIIGAFLAGLFLREEIVEEKLFQKIEDRVFGLGYSLFGPIFFASLAFHLDFSVLQENALFLFLFILVAVFGKLLGAGIPAYFLKMSGWEATAVGVAMNSRGAVELIIATLGLESGIIGKEIFSALVIMAFVTTLISILLFKPLSHKLTA